MQVRCYQCKEKVDFRRTVGFLRRLCFECLDDKISLIKYNVAEKYDLARKKIKCANCQKEVGHDRIVFHAVIAYADTTYYPNWVVVCSKECFHAMNEKYIMHLLNDEDGMSYGEMFGLGLL